LNVVNTNIHGASEIGLIKIIRVPTRKTHTITDKPVKIAWKSYPVDLWSTFLLHSTLAC